MNEQQRQLLGQMRAAYAQRDFAQARPLCEQFLSRWKKNAEALFIMGNVLQNERRFDEAARHFERSAALDPKNTGVLLGLANMLPLSGKLAPALRRVDRALKLKPDHREAILLKAAILDARSDDEPLRALLEPIAASDPQDATCGLYLARTLYREGRQDDAVALLRRHASGPALTAEQQRRVNYQLGQYLERGQDYDGAFAAFEAANRAEAKDADSEGHRRHLDDVIDTYSAEFLAGAPRANNALDQPVLIVGMPRTGSTMLEQVLDRHRLVAGAGETLALRRLAGDAGLLVGSTEPYPRYVRDMDADDANRLGQMYVDELRHAGFAATRIVDKLLLNYEHLGFLSLIVPRARVLDCRRNPVDTCLSCYASDLDTASNPWSTDLEAIGLRYRQHERLMEHWWRVLDLPMLRVRYEDLVDDLEGRAREVLEFLDLPWDDRCLKFHESSRSVTTLSRDQVRRPIYRTSMGRAERFGDRLAPLRAALASP
ncbi:MAG: tetratricopeptide repeat protein [Planctomycetes bacterium]|nr:tetratricopeptide repeat protein [Planctomycetota bacterium]